MLAHIRDHCGLGSYGCPRMTMEMKEVGLAVGEHRVGRLMRLNGIKLVRNRKHIHAQRAGLEPYCDTALTVCGTDSCGSARRTAQA